jgi:peptidoglycan/xylan/chitin deacetylase (PgdA/CDA1 family)
MRELLYRGLGKYRRTSANVFCRRKVVLGTGLPIISFTFDDAPRSAFTTGAEVVTRHGARATFFVCLSLLDSYGDSGKLASAEDLVQAVADGHELGCHTFDHLDAWSARTELFMASIDKNQSALKATMPGIQFRTFAYPKSGPTLAVKRRIRNRFVCCRGGGQAPNTGVADLNLLKACFLDRRTAIDMSFVDDLICRNFASGGWLIFATHDVAANPSPYGCTTDFFAEVVDRAARSGAVLLPVAAACDELLSRLPDQ